MVKPAVYTIDQQKEKEKAKEAQVVTEVIITQQKFIYLLSIFHAILPYSLNKKE